MPAGALRCSTVRLKKLHGSNSNLQARKEAATPRGVSVVSEWVGVKSVRYHLSAVPRSPAR